MPIPAVGAPAARALLASAAAVLVALGGGLAIGHRVSRSSASREYVTVAGQRSSVTLIDGTQLTLAPASRVRVPADYGRSVRTVVLEGEAYFAVVHDAAHPFAVRAHGVVIRDVGTAFDVRAYPEDAGARVAVADGAVAVSPASGCAMPAVGALAARPPSADTRASGCGVQARAGDVARVSEDGAAIEHDMDVQAITSWTSGRLVFDDTALPDVVRILSRWYGAPIALGDVTLSSRVYSATLDGQPVREVVAVLAAAVAARVQQRGDTLVLVASGQRNGGR